MFRSRWLYIIAPIGLGLLLLATIGYYRIQEAQSDPYPDARHNPARNASEPVLAQNQQVTPPAYDPRCQAPQDREDSDLCAQWSAVEAMKEANRVNQIALRAGWFEFIALLISIFFTGWAAIAAAKAAAAADKVVGVTEDTAKRQLRAYVSVEPCGITLPEDGVPRAPILVHNRGQTPAYNVTLAYQVDLHRDPRNFYPEEDKALVGQASDGTLAPNQDRHIYTAVGQPSVEDMRAIAKRELAIVHWGVVQYRDAFNTARETRFAFYHWGDELSDTNTKRCRLWNDAS